MSRDPTNKNNNFSILRQLLLTVKIVNFQFTHLSVRERYGKADYECCDPCDGDDSPALCLRPPGHGLDGEDDGQEAVERHEDQRVDGHERGRDDQQLDNLAPEEFKRLILLPRKITDEKFVLTISSKNL